MPYPFVVAWRHLRARRRASVSVIGAIAILGIMLGVGVLSAVLAVTSGFQTAFREKVLGVNAHLLVLKFGWDFTEYRDVIGRVRAEPGVIGAAPFLINPMMITRGDRIAGVLVKGVDPDLLGEVLDLPTYLVEGSIRGLRRAGATPPSNLGDDTGHASQLDLDDYLRDARAEVARPPQPVFDDEPPAPLGTPVPAPPSPISHAATEPSGTGVATPLPSGATPAYTIPGDIGEDPLERLAREDAARVDTHDGVHAEQLAGVIVGRTLARTLGLHVGDAVRIISPLTGADAALVRHGTTPRSRDFRVTAVFEAGFDEYDSRLVYTDLWEAQRFFEQGDAVTGVEVKVNDIDRAVPIGHRIERDLGGGPFHTLDWEALNHNLFTALKLQKFLLSIVITIIVVVAAFNVIATLVMVVLDKRREIAILKAMGAAPWGIRQIFLLQGIAIGGTGTIAGLMLGGGICAALTRWHFKLDPQVYLISFVPVRASAEEFTLTAAIALAITLVAAAIPAAWAARLTPVEGLRAE